MANNLILYDVDKLKELGINFKLTYTVEFTQNKIHYEEMTNKGIYDNIIKKEFDNIEEPVNFLIKLSDDKRKYQYYIINCGYH